jgi:WD40 repeat protein
LLAYSGDDKIIKIWSVWDCKEISKLRGHLNPLLSIAFSADSKLLASGSQDAMIKLWSV